MALIEFTNRGLFCSQGNFYIDPWQPVDHALITHGHSDHARAGSRNYLCHPHTKPVLQLRLGDGNYQTTEWGESHFINNVRVSFHPAGHILGSSQIRLEYKGEVWVVSGDYKTENDGISGAFEPVRCNTFITESTFGLPIYRWKPQHEVYADICRWIERNKRDGKTSILIAYALGKSQRVLDAIKDIAGERIYAHGAICNIHETLVNAGIANIRHLPTPRRIAPDVSKDELRGSVVIAPPSAESSPWIKRFTPYSIGICSGWMQVRGNQRRKNADAGFALSDHCDWSSLLSAVSATGASMVYATHGFQSAFSRYLNESGIGAAEVKTEYGVETEEAGTEEAGTPLEENNDEAPAYD